MESLNGTPFRCLEIIAYINKQCSSYIDRDFRGVETCCKKYQGSGCSYNEGGPVITKTHPTVQILDSGLDQIH